MTNVQLTEEMFSRVALARTDSTASYATMTAVSLVVMPADFSVTAMKVLLYWCKYVMVKHLLHFIVSWSLKLQILRVKINQVGDWSVLPKCRKTTMSDTLAYRTIPLYLMEKGAPLISANVEPMRPKKKSLIYSSIPLSWK